MAEYKSLTGDMLKVGMVAERTKTVTKQDIQYFGELSTDFNPMHFNEEYAATTQFGRCIAHGVISLAFCGSVLGEQMPGLGTIHMSQEVTFKKPVYPGDTITAHEEVISIDYKEKAKFYIVKIKQTVTNQDGVVVTEGVATVMPPKVPVVLPE